ncbi:MAG: hypothetical protein HYV27_16250 [Candidatus Hydrogenedentes bacterium]|nr:hypothetical protein [Candidatus Hydrogenedentota bacterium]
MRAILVVVLSMSLSGCLVELLTTTAIQGELQAKNATAATRVLGKVKEDQAQMQAKHAIDAYRAEKGVNPASLEELVPAYMAELPKKPDGSVYGYDPNTGQLLDQPYDPMMPTPQDAQTIAAIRDAINAYGTAVGYYPNRLDDLAPNYLAAAPRTSGGEEFLYNNQNGDVSHPRAGQRPQMAGGGQRTGGGVGAGGPMGEAMTGVAMQQQLNSNSQAGASSAGTRSRQSVGAIGDANTQRQTQAMDNLGL